MEKRLEELLNERDDTLFLHGACHVFALALHQQLKYPIVVLLDNKSALHAYCRFGEGKLFDFFGIKDEVVALKEWAREYGWRGGPKEVSPADLMTFYKNNCHPEFLRVAHQRAQNHIEKNRNHFSGKDMTPIPKGKTVDSAPIEVINQILGDGDSIMRRQ